jgi:hypothetical protein
MWITNVTLWLAVLRGPTGVYGTMITSAAKHSLSVTLAGTVRSTMQFSIALCQIIQSCCAARGIEADKSGGMPEQAVLTNNTNTCFSRSATKAWSDIISALSREAVQIPKTVRLQRQNNHHRILHAHRKYTVRPASFSTVKWDFLRDTGGVRRI